MAQILRKTLITYDNSSHCFSMIDKLNDDYKKTFNKNSLVELYYSRGGSELKPNFSITAYYEQSQEDDIKFFENQLNS